MQTVGGDCESGGDGLEKAEMKAFNPQDHSSHLLFLPSVKNIRASEPRSECHSEPIAVSRGRGCTVGQHPWGQTAKMRLYPQQELQCGLETLGHGTRGIYFQRLLMLKFSHLLLLKKNID